MKPTVVVGTAAEGESKRERMKRERRGVLKEGSILKT